MSPRSWLGQDEEMRREGWVTATDRTSIAFRDYGGTGRPLVLLHGGGANLESMDQYAAHFASVRRCVAVDVRACGQSGDPERFRLEDAAADIGAVVDGLDLGPIDLIGHSMGGFIAGFFGSTHPDSRVVSIDGFGPGMVTVGSAAEREEFRGFQEDMKASFFEMTAAPETGDSEWRQSQVEMLCAVYPRIGYTAPNARAMAERNFVDIGDGMWRRHPPRQLFSDSFEDDASKDILRMYRWVSCPTLIIRCTHSGAPAVLDTELEALENQNASVEVLRLPMTHLAPAWDTLEEVAAEIERFFAANEPPA